MIPVSFLSDCPIGSARLRYRASDFYILTEPEVGPGRDRWRASVDDLTISVSPETRVFWALDAYAPSACWVADKCLSPPRNPAQRAMRLEAQFDDRIARLALPRGVVRYVANIGESLLLIRLGQCRATEHFRFASQLIAGVDRRSCLTEVWCFDVQGVGS